MAGVSFRPCANHMLCGEKDGETGRDVQRPKSNRGLGTFRHAESCCCARVQQRGRICKETASHSSFATE
jgi:hypothetical protein